MSKPRVFISMGTPYMVDYSKFRDELENLLRDVCHVDPRIIGKNEYPDGSPLAKIKAVMRECHGVIVVAYERKFLESGLEKRHGHSPINLMGKTYTTPWNHIESAMAYALGLPIYILCQPGLTEEGLIEDKIDWYVQRTSIKVAELKRPDVRESISSWVENRVVPFSKRPNIFRILKGSSKFSDLTPREIFGALAVLIAAFSGGAAAATMLPQLF